MFKNWLFVLWIVITMQSRELVSMTQLNDFSLSKKQALHVLLRLIGNLVFLEKYPPKKIFATKKDFSFITTVGRNNDAIMQVIPIGKNEDLSTIAFRPGSILENVYRDKEIEKNKQLYTFFNANLAEKKIVPYFDTIFLNPISQNRTIKHNRSLFDIVRDVLKQFEHIDDDSKEFLQCYYPKQHNSFIAHLGDNKEIIVCVQSFSKTYELLEYVNLIIALSNVVAEKHAPSKEDLSGEISFDTDFVAKHTALYEYFLHNSGSEILDHENLPH